MKTNSPPRRISGRLKQRQEFLINVAQGGIMLEQSQVDFSETFQNGAVGCGLLAQAHKCPHNEHAHLNRSLAAKNVRGHQRAMLRKNPWPIARIPMALGTGRNLRPVLFLPRQFIGLPAAQRGELACRQPKYELLRKARTVAAKGFVEPTRGYSIQSCERGIDYDPLATYLHDCWRRKRRIPRPCPLNALRVKRMTHAN